MRASLNRAWVVCVGLVALLLAPSLAVSSAGGALSPAGARVCRQAV